MKPQNVTHRLFVGAASSPRFFRLIFAARTPLPQVLVHDPCAAAKQRAFQGTLAELVKDSHTSAVNLDAIQARPIMYCICDAFLNKTMKTTTIPPLRVSPELRAQAEAVLEEGETLSAFVLDAVTRSIEYRKARHEFIARGLASAVRAKKTGHYVSAGRVIVKLERRLRSKQRTV